MDGLWPEEELEEVDAAAEAEGVPPKEISSAARVAPFNVRGQSQRSMWRMIFALQGLVLNP